MGRFPWEGSQSLSEVEFTVSVNTRVVVKDDQSLPIVTAASSHDDFPQPTPEHVRSRNYAQDGVPTVPDHGSPPPGSSTIFEGQEEDSGPFSARPLSRRRHPLAVGYP